MGDDPHVALKQLRSRLRNIYEAVSSYRQQTPRPPVIYSSTKSESIHEGLQHNISGFRRLKGSIKVDLDILEKFLDDPESRHKPPISTNAPYLVAVWNEFLCAPAPVEAVFQFMPLHGQSISSVARGRRAVNGSNPVKVDIVADNGKSWIRINTVKNSRLLAEFREIDSYLIDSDDGCMEGSQPSLAQSEFDNSVLRMGRSLVAAARANPVKGTEELPRVTLRLTRLDPSPAVESDGDVRIAKTVQTLRGMGIHVVLGDRRDDELSACLLSNPYPVSSVSPTPPSPTININLDLSVLIALVSDITHAPLPASVEEANRRFIPPDSYRAWKKKKKSASDSKKLAQLSVDQVESTGPGSSLDMPEDYEKHSRALTDQLLQEMSKGLLQEIYDSTSSVVTSGKAIIFSTTAEARERCLRIVAKIGGPSERRRAHALFWTVSTLSTQALTITEAEEAYWQGSRYRPKFISLFPIHLYPEIQGPDPSFSPGPEKVYEQKSQFFNELVKVCKRILAEDTAPHRRNLPLPDELLGRQPLSNETEIRRADVTKVNPRLTAHTVQSLLRGAERGWTTLTANRSSIKMILKEMTLLGFSTRIDSDNQVQCGEDDVAHPAAIWVVDPRSLAEGMSS